MFVPPKVIWPLWNFLFLHLSFHCFSSAFFLPLCFFFSLFRFRSFFLYMFWIPGLRVTLQASLYLPYITSLFYISFFFSSFHIFPHKLASISSSIRLLTFHSFPGVKFSLFSILSFLLKSGLCVTLYSSSLHPHRSLERNMIATLTNGTFQGLTRLKTL